MKYIYTAGPYTEFRGYVFIHGKPTTILDKGTQLAIAKRADFKPYEEPTQKAAAPRKTLVLPKRKPA